MAVTGQAAKLERTAIGALLIVAASACFATSGLFVQLAAPAASEPVIIFMGFAVGGLVVIPLALSRGPRFLASPNVGLLSTRALVGILQISALFIALQSIPLLDTTLMRQAAPLWIPVLGLLLFGERMPGVLWLPILAGFAGMALVLHPHIAGVKLGYLFALATGVLFGLQNILTRRLNVASEPTLRILFYLYTTGILVALVPALLTLKAMPAVTWLYLVGSGAALLLSTTCVIRGYGHGPAFVLAPFGYSVVGFSALIDWAVFGIVPGLLTVAGMVVILGACVALLFLNRRLQVAAR